MRVRANLLTGLLLLSVASVAGTASAAGTASSADLRLVDAAKQRDQNAVRSLLKQHVPVNAAKADGTTALSWAVYHDDAVMTDLLIAAGADVNAANEYGVTPLSLACTNRNTTMVGKLANAGANPNIAQWDGETPLMTCASTGVLEGVKALLSHGAGVNAKEKDQHQTALMWAAAGKHPEIVRVLVEHRADVRARSKTITLPEPFIIPTPSVFGFNYPTNVHFPKTSGGFTALLFAAQQGDVDSARVLLDAGADVNEGTPEDGAALVIAAASGHEKLALYLLDRGADPNAKNAYGLTTLHYALHEGLLILSGFKASPSDQLGWKRPNMPALVKVLLARGADPNARIAHAFPTLENEFLGRGSEDQSQVDPVGATPFLLAAAAGDVLAMRILVEGHADTRMTTAEGVTSMMVAAGLGTERNARSEKSALEAAKLAVELGGDVNAPMKDGRTPLHAAAYLGWNEMVRFLVEKGAKLDAKDMYGETPLSIAMGDPEGLLYRVRPGGRYDERFWKPKEQKKTAELLLQLGAPPFTGKVRDRSGE